MMRKSRGQLYYIYTKVYIACVREHILHHRQMCFIVVDREFCPGSINFFLERLAYI